METRSEQFLHAQIEEFTKQFAYQHIDGVSIEIQDFFSLTKNIKKFTWTFDQQSKHYKITVQLEEFSLVNVNKVFLGFAHFIGYKEADLYVRKPIEHGYHYLFASLKQKGLGFCCEIDIIA
ncbi:MAG TPA: hypothetical protein VKY19_18795 [Ktedonosporobacter sp.]|jgi:hypothetical protein|nr:hypothetical protein [Ktedonosporobacter sp.]